KNPITMKTSKLLQNKCLVALMYICLSPLCCMAQEKSERVVDGIIEIINKDNREQVSYHYTSEEARNTYISLKSTLIPVSYQKMYHDESPFTAGIGCRDYICNHFRDYIPTASKIGSGRTRIDIAMYSLTDGSVVLRDMRCKESLLDILDSDRIHKLIDIIHSYKFKPADIKGNYRLFWNIPIYISKQ
ncbi:MAG: hypothetical protein K2G12_07505, partial [Prevotella sp.]|nr:hypothetical protein [Prevotella sp.]